jgi:hypothetical protein
MMSQLLADAVVLAHVGFVLFVLFGGLLVFWWPRLVWLHLPAVAWGVAVEYGGWICPLTPLEHWLRSDDAADGSAGFIGDYLLPLLYPTGLTREVQMALGTVVVIVNLAVYGSLLRRRSKGIHARRSHSLHHLVQHAPRRTQEEHRKSE